MHKWLIGIGAVVAAIVIYFVGFHVYVTSYPAPPKLEEPFDVPVPRSTVVTRVEVPIEQVRAGFERDLPRQLATIDERVEECVPSEQVSLLGADLFKTPRLGCNLVGTITRGRIEIGGNGRDLRARLPVTARIEVRDIGDVIKRETMTAKAMVTVDAGLGLSSDWALDPDIRLDYAWMEEPGIDFAGQRITFTGPVDKQLPSMLRKVERQLETRLRAVDLRSEVEKVWQSGFDTISVNRENPPVWLRLSPHDAGMGALEVDGNMLTSELLLEADLELFVGDEPKKPQPTELGANKDVIGDDGFSISLPVLADYAEIEPVILRALRKLAAKGIKFEQVGELKADFRDVALYATQNGRIAVGVDAEVEPIGNMGRNWGRSRGRVWLVGDPVTATGSEVVRIRDLHVFGDTDSSVGDLLVFLLASSPVQAEIERGLVEDFRADYEELLGKARKALASVKVGRFDLAFDLDEVEHGKIIATRDGLFMPVVARGKAETRVIPK